MGAIRAWTMVITGFFTLGASFIYSQPIFDFLFAVGMAMGGNAANVSRLCQTSLTILPYPIAGMLILAGWIEGTRKEDNSRW